MRSRPRRTLISVLGALGLAFVAAAGCSNTLTGNLVLITGPDDGFAQSPRPTSLTIQLVDYETGDASVIGETSLPAPNGITLPAEDPDTIDILRATAYVDGGAVVSGASIPLTLGELSGASLNLFVQRNGQFSRLPSVDGGTAELATPTSSAPLLTTYSEFLLIADGTGKSTSTQVYDTFLWGVGSVAPRLPVAPASIAYVDSYTGTDAATEGGSVAAILTIGTSGNGFWLDLTDSTSVDAEYIANASLDAGDAGIFLDVAGGQSVVNVDDGSVYIVGATRTTGKPTSAILQIAANGTLHRAALLEPRLGASAAYVSGAGLYVYGGNASGADASTLVGAEELVKGTAAAVAVSGVPADPTTGAGAVALDTTHILLAGGVTPDGAGAPVRLFTFGEGGAMTTGKLPVAFVTAQLFAITPPGATGGWSAIVLGTEASGMTSAYKLTENGSPTLIPFRAPRSHAQGIVLPNGSLGLVGADATTIESFIP